MSKIGSIGEFREWVSQIIRDPAAAQDFPKRWFDSEETARAALSARLAAAAAVECFLAEAGENPATGHMSATQLAEFVAWKLELDERRAPYNDETTVSSLYSIKILCS